MINLKKIKAYCYEDPSLIENYDKAIKDNTQTWNCHHRVETIMNCGRKELIAQGCYKNRPAHDLIFLPYGEHSRLHNAGKKRSANTRAKISVSMSGENNSMFGKHHSEETREKMSAAKRGENHPMFGKHLSEEHRAVLCGKRLGMHWYNNGVKEMPAYECPDGWAQGRLRKKK